MKKVIISILFGCTGIIVAAAPAAAEKKIILQRLSEYKGPKTFLLSYPRSGNTWMRYCLEYNTKRPTFHQLHHDTRNQPLAWLANFEIDHTKPPIEKIHDLTNQKFDKSNDQIILLVRNPKEAIKRHGNKPSLSKEQIKKDHLYFDNIDLYHSWNPQKRIIIYYEDLISQPAATLTPLIQFLGESTGSLDEFIKNYEQHQKKAIEIYRESYSKAKDLLFHSKKMSPEIRKQIDNWIEELYPMPWNNYLKDRFSEAVLHYDKKDNFKSNAIAATVVHKKVIQ